MRAAEIRSALAARVRMPLGWLSLATFGGMFGLFAVSDLAQRGFQGPTAWLAGLPAPVFAATGYGFLSPLPWQWSGDDRVLAGPLRGSLQALLASLLFCLFLHYLHQALFLGLLHPDRLTRLGSLSLFPYLFQVPFMVLVGLFIALGERSHLEQHRMAARLKEAQWILLRAQLSPHVLFNTLNALAELARRDPEATERALLDLSELYERMLVHGDQLLAPLRDERRILERYLSLQALRFGPRLEVTWEWDPAVNDVPTPPLLLQPLVENALKHGISRQPGAQQLRLRAWKEGPLLRLQVWNTGTALANPVQKGTGITNLESRIALAYGGRGAFSLERQESWTVATLELPEQAWTR